MDDWIVREKETTETTSKCNMGIDEIKRFTGATLMRIAAKRDMWKEKGVPLSSSG